MAEASDTIAAVATAPGRSAVGVVRLSGAAVTRMAEIILGDLPPPRVASLRQFRRADGTAIDVGLALYFPAPASFTGEPVLELQGHGGTHLLDELLQRALELGARQARPGEFTERAFLNGKMDLTQAEAVADLIDAGTAGAAKAAMRSLQGEFSARIRTLQEQLTELRVYVEAAIDFPEEEIDFASSSALRHRLERANDALESILAAARQGALLREGQNVVVAGKPNAGKSSLLNRLVGADVAIVTASPGTTRDLLRHSIDLDGLPLNLIDTAGLRAAGDEVEQEGIRRARSEIQRADRILYVQDASLADGLPEDFDVPAGVPVTWVMNKIDLSGDLARLDVAAGEPRLYISAKSGAGFDLLRAHLKSSAGYRDAESGVFSARRRHLDALRRAGESLKRAQHSLLGARAVELMAEDLRLSQRSLSEVTGELTSDDLLGEIFGSFCIGK